MKVVLFLVALGVCISFSEGKVFGLCIKQDDCEEDECCLKFTTWINKCVKRREEGETCTVKELKVPFTDIHLVKCPCQEDLTCEEREGFGGKLIGKCVADEEIRTTRDITVETDAPVIPDQTDPPAEE